VKTNIEKILSKQEHAGIKSRKASGALFELVAGTFDVVIGRLATTQYATVYNNFTQRHSNIIGDQCPSTAAYKMNLLLRGNSGVPKYGTLRFFEV